MPYRGGQSVGRHLALAGVRYVLRKFLCGRKPSAWRGVAIAFLRCVQLSLWHALATRYDFRTSMRMRCCRAGCPPERAFSIGLSHVGIIPVGQILLYGLQRATSSAHYTMSLTRRVDGSCSSARRAAGRPKGDERRAGVRGVRSRQRLYIKQEPLWLLFWLAWRRICQPSCSLRRYNAAALTSKAAVVPRAAGGWRTRGTRRIGVRVQGTKPPRIFAAITLRMAG